MSIKLRAESVYSLRQVGQVGSQEGKPQPDLFDLFRSHNRQPPEGRELDFLSFPMKHGKVDATPCKRMQSPCKTPA